jgi:signal transduction histidine kinase
MSYKYPQSINKYLHEHSSLVVLDMDGHGVIREANRFAQSLAGKELRGLPMQEFFVDFITLPDVNTILKEGVHKQMLNVKTFHGLPQTMYFSSLSTTDGFMLIGEIDHIEVEELRNSMITLNNELNNLARELQKKNIELDQLNKLKNQFLGMAAHDLRNPIGSIMMFSEFILDEHGDEITPDIKQIIDIIRTSSQYMLKLLDELLDVVKIESGKMELNYRETQLTLFLRKIIEINAIIAEKKHIKIELNSADSLLKASFDQVKIEQVLNNLISNAIKYSPHHTTITVSAFGTNNEVVVSVQDQGQGIPKKEMNLLFKPFAKISVQGTDGEKSTGLGLSIVKKIIIGHMGRIWVDSEVGKGTTFYFSIPFNRDTAESKLS